MADQPTALLPIMFRPGVNREQTQYASETVGTNSPGFTIVGSWYKSQLVRFRQGFPEKIGGWYPLSLNTYLGVCRSLFNWFSLTGISLIGVGTNLKFYINEAGSFYDITPIRGTQTLTNPFTAIAGQSTITVNATAHGAVTGDFVTFSGATGLGGNITAAVLNQQYQVTVLSVNVYTFTATATANASDASGSPGGGTVTATYQINTGPAIEVPLYGWGSGTWGSGVWGTSSSTTV